jgi:hypothetical protein
MRELSEVVALLRRPEPRCRTLRVVGKEWRRHSVLHEAFMAATPPGATVVTGVRTLAEPEPEAGEETWKWWSRAPDRLKVEFVVGDETVTVWFEGATWWSWSPSQGARTNEGRQNLQHGKGPGEVLVSPGQAAKLLDFELLGAHSLLSRSGYRLLARPVARGDLDLHALGAGADEYELVVDADCGFLLRSEAKFDGKPFKVLEMTEVAVDADFATSIFTPQAPGGAPFEYVEPVCNVSLEELPLAVPFRVFVPGTAPARPVLVQVHNAQPRMGIPLSAVIFYSVPDPGSGHAIFWLHESGEVGPVPSPPGEALTQVDDLTVVTDESMGHLRQKVLVERDGTYIRVESNSMAVDELIGLARSLVPAVP